MNRHKTIREKEIENLPDCPYDPFNNSKCNYPNQPPDPRKDCEPCLAQSMSDALIEKNLALITRTFIAYRKLARGFKHAEG